MENKNPFKPIPPDCTDLTGTVRGKITITGYLGKQRVQKWQGKCECGATVVRQGIKWRKGLRNKTWDYGCAKCNWEYKKERVA